MTISSIVNIVETLAVRFGRAASPWNFTSRFTPRFAEDTDTPLRASAGYGETVLKTPTANIAAFHRGIAIYGNEKVQGVDMDVFAGCPNYSPYRSTVGAVSPLTPARNHAILLHAARMILRRCPTTQFLIVGDGPELPTLERLAARLGIAERVLFCDSDDPAVVDEMLRAMDVFVAPAFCEGLPDNLLDAMAAGLPVVATECGRCDTVVTHGETGFLFNPENAGLLAEYAVMLLRDPRRARAMGAAARRSVLTKSQPRVPVTEITSHREGVAVAVS